jgi:fluoride exporter
MHKLIWLGLAGALGTLARYGVALAVGRLAGAGFPLGTLVVNLVGCFLFGLVLTLSRERGLLGQVPAEIVLVGFMGAFTTFSSYVGDSVFLAQGARAGHALLNVTFQNLGGFASFLLGAALARLL